MPRVGLRTQGPMTLRQALLAALVVVATIVCASAILWVYWDLAVR